MVARLGDRSKWLLHWGQAQVIAQVSRSLAYIRHEGSGTTNGAVFAGHRKPPESAKRALVSVLPSFSTTTSLFVGLILCSNLI